MTDQQQAKTRAVWAFERIREAIRDRYAAGESVEALANDYGVSVETIRKVVGLK